VEPLAPGGRINAELPNDELQPLGNPAAAKLKLELLQTELSSLVSVTVKLSVAPDATQALCDGDIVSDGLAWVQLAPANVTCTLAVPPTDTGVIVTPAVVSW
jgi:hypothetical protein